MLSSVVFVGYHTKHLFIFLIYFFMIFTERSTLSEGAKIISLKVSYELSTNNDLLDLFTRTPSW